MHTLQEIFVRIKVLQTNVAASSTKGAKASKQTIKRQVNTVITKISKNESEELRKKLKEMDEIDEEEHSPLVSVIRNLAFKKSPTKPDMHPTRDSRE